MPVAEPAERPAGYVQSLDKGLAAIRCFSAEAPRLTISEVARVIPEIGRAHV